MTTERFFMPLYMDRVSIDDFLVMPDIYLDLIDKEDDAVLIVAPRGVNQVLITQDYFVKMNHIVLDQVDEIAQLKEQLSKLSKEIV